MKKGKPFEPGNKFGKGRPKGSRNKSTMRYKQILEESADALVRKSVLLALTGDTQMLRTLVDRLLPRRPEPRVKIGAMPMSTAAEVDQAAGLVGEMTLQGKLTVNDAQAIASLLENRRRSIESRDLERRMQAVEQALDPKGKRP